MFGGRVGVTQLIIILVIVLLLFGARRLPDLARSLGRSTKEFRDGLEEGAGEDDKPDTDGTTSETPSPPSTNNNSSG